MFEGAKNIFDFASQKEKIKLFNSENKFYKKGIALMRFVLHFLHFNIYESSKCACTYLFRGSVNISTAAVEMVRE
jgi:xanthine dehydrogenase molybdopterin-binding subunit B